MQSRYDAEPSVEPFIETIIRLPSILVLHVSRALELQIGFKQSFMQSFYGVSCRVFTELRVELLQSSVQSSVHPPRNFFRRALSFTSVQYYLALRYIDESSVIFKRFVSSIKLYKQKSYIYTIGGCITSVSISVARLNFDRVAYVQSSNPHQFLANPNTHLKLIQYNIDEISIKFSKENFKITNFQPAILILWRNYNRYLAPTAGFLFLLQ